MKNNPRFVSLMRFSVPHEQQQQTLISYPYLALAGPAYHLIKNRMECLLSSQEALPSNSKAERLLIMEIGKQTE